MSEPESFSAMTAILHQILDQQVRQTHLVGVMVEQQAQLLEALADEQGDDAHAPPATFLDGTPKALT